MVEDMNTYPTPATLDPPSPESKEAAIEARFLAAKEIADKHGYYYSVLSDEEKVDYRLALSQEGFDQEIALLKTKLKATQLLYPFNIPLTARLMALLERLQGAQRTLFKKDEDTKSQPAEDELLGKFGIPPGHPGQRFGLSPARARPVHAGS